MAKNNLNTIQEDALNGNMKSSYPGWNSNTTGTIIGGGGTDDSEGKPGFWKGFLNSAKQLLTSGTLRMPTGKSYPAPPPYNDATLTTPSGRHVQTMEHINRFHKGNEWGTGASNDVFYDGHEDPTFLTFKVEFGEWGASITDNESIASVQRLSINNNTWLMDYDQMPMGLLDLNYNAEGDFNDLETYNAFNYLMNRNEDRRAEYVRDFVEGLYSIQRDFPYIFQKINGVDKLTTVDTKQGQRLKDCVLKLSCLNDGLDWKMRTLMELYRKAAWDDVYQRWSLPDTHRFFKMIIYVFDAKTIAMGGGQFSPDNEMLPILAFECSPCEFVIGNGLDQAELTVDYKNLHPTEPTIDIRVMNVRTYYCNRMFKRVKYINDMYAASLHSNSITYTDSDGNIIGSTSQTDGDATMSDGRTIAWQYVWLQRMFMLSDEWALGAHWNAPNETTAKSHYFADERDEAMLNETAAASLIDQMPDNTWHYATVSDEGYIIHNFKDLWGAVKDIITSRTQLIRDSRTSNRYYFVNDLFYIDLWSELARQHMLEIDVRGARADVIRKIKQMLRHLKEYTINDTSLNHRIEDVSIEGAPLPDMEPEPYIIPTAAPIITPDVEIKGEPYQYNLEDVSIEGAENPDMTPNPSIIQNIPKFVLDDVSIEGAENPEMTPNPSIIQNIPKFVLDKVVIDGAENPDKKPELNLEGDERGDWYLTLDISGGESKPMRMQDIIKNRAPKRRPDVFIIQNLDRYTDALAELDMNLEHPDMNLAELSMNLDKIIQDMTELDMNLDNPDLNLTELDLNLAKYHGPLEELILNLDKQMQNLTELELNLTHPDQELTEIQADLHKNAMDMAALILNLSKTLMELTGLTDDTSLPELDMIPMSTDASVPSMSMSELIMNIQRIKQNLTTLDMSVSKSKMDMVTVDVTERAPDAPLTELVKIKGKPASALSPEFADNHKPAADQTPAFVYDYKYDTALTPADRNANLPDETMTPADLTAYLPEQEMTVMDNTVILPDQVMNAQDRDSSLPELTMTHQDLETELPEQKLSELRDDAELPEQKMNEQDVETELPDQKLAELLPDDERPSMKLAELNPSPELPELKMDNIEQQPYEPSKPTVSIDQETEIPEMKMAELNSDDERPEMLMPGVESSDEKPDMKMAEVVSDDEKPDMKLAELLLNDETPTMNMPDVSDDSERPDMLMAEVVVNDDKLSERPMEEIIQNTDHDYKIYDSEVKEDVRLKENRQENLRVGMKDVKVTDNSGYAKDLLANRIKMLQNLDTDTLESASFEQLNKLVGILQDTVSQVNRNIKMQELEVRQEKTGRTMKMQRIIADDEPSHFGTSGHMKEMLSVSQDAMDRAEAAYARAHEKKK